jgi:hypothetical protein
MGLLFVPKSPDFHHPSFWGNLPLPLWDEYENGYFQPNSTLLP